MFGARFYPADAVWNLSGAVREMSVLLRDPSGAQDEAGDRLGDIIDQHPDMVVQLRNYSGAVKVCSGDVCACAGEVRRCAEHI